MNPHPILRSSRLSQPSPAARRKLPFIPKRTSGVEALEARIAPAALLTATKVDVFAPGGDVNGDGNFDPGDTILYTVTITNAGDVDLTGVTFQDLIDGNTTLGAINASPLARNDLYTAQANTQLVVGVPTILSGVNTTSSVNPLTNDSEFFGDSGVNTILTSFQSTSANGGSVAMVTTGANAGSFSYVPAPGFTGVDTFTYTLRDDGFDGIAGNSDDLSSTGTISISVVGTNNSNATNGPVVWYVDSAYGGANGAANGTSARPFTTLTSLNVGGDPDDAGDTIYLFESGAAYTAGITLEGSQTLIGEGTALVVNGNTLNAAGTAPTISLAAGTAVTLGSGNTLTGFTIGNSQRDILGNNFGTLTVSNVTLNGTGKTLDLTTGSFAAGSTFNSISTTGTSGLVAQGHGMQLISVGGSVSFGSTTISGTEIQGIFVNASTANINFGNTTIGTGTAGSGSGANTEGIRFESNTAGTRTFGTLTIQNTGANGIGFLIGDTAGTTTIGGAANISGTSNHAVSVSGGGAVGFQTLNISGVTGTGGGIVLTNHNASFSATAGTIGTVAGTDVSITGGTGSVTIPQAITNTAGGFIAIDNHETGNVTFSGNLSSTNAAGGISVQNVNSGIIAFTGATKTLSTTTGAAVNLVTNAGGTINFTGGGLTITTTSGTGFSATGGGTVSVQGTANTINSTSGATALNIVSTNIGAGELNFRSISSTGGTATGIILDTTGSAGGLNVTGTGAAGSGGTISNKTGADGSFTTGNGIYLNSTSDVRLASLQLNDFQNSAIRGFGVNGFSLEDSVISGTVGTSTGEIEGAIAFGHVGPAFQNGLTGNSLIDNVNISGSIEHHVEVYNQSGTMHLTISNSNIHDNSVAGGSDGIQMEFRGTAQGFINIDGNSFSNNKSQAIQISALETSNIHTTISSNTITRGTQGNEGIVLSNGGDADLRALIGGPSVGDGNTISGFGGVAIFAGQVAGQGSAASLLEVTIQGNSVTSPLSATNHAIVAFLSSATGQVSEARIRIDSNTVNYASDAARSILVDTPDTGRTPNFHATVTNNVVNSTNAGALTQISVAARNGATGRADVRGNDVNMVAAGTQLNVREATGGSIVLARGASASNDSGVVLAANNTASVTAILPTVGDVPVVENNTIGLPANPTLPTLPLFFAPTVEDSTPGELPPVETPSEVTPPVDGGGTPPLTVPTPPVFVDDGILSQGELDTLVAAAIARWEATGLTPAQSALLHNVNFSVSDLPGWYLGQASGTNITLDADAAGNAWFVDTTPLDDSEFVNGQATANGGAYGRVDALTTITHELGHVLGLSDNYSSAQSDSLMYGFIGQGERRVATTGLAAGVVADGDAHDGVEYINSTLNIGDLGVGKSVVVQFRATINSTITANSVSNQGTVDSNETAATLTDDPSVGGVADATVTPVDLPDVTVSVAPGAVAEDGSGTLVYTFTREGAATNALTANFSVSGTTALTGDFTLSGTGLTYTAGAAAGTITFAAGSNIVTVTMSATDDTVVEADETVILTVATGTTGYDVGTPATATGTINNDDTDVSVAVSPGSVTEDGAGNLVYTFTRTGVTSDAKQINFTVTGTASLPDGDFSVSASNIFSLGTFTGLGTIVFPAGSSTVTFTVNPFSDSAVEADETAIVTVTSGPGYNVATPSAATGTIANDDADVTLAVAPATVTEDGVTNLVYTFTRTGFTANAITVNFNVGGSATFNTDYAQTGAATFTNSVGTVSFAAGATTATVTLNPTTDTTVEGDETTLLTLTAGSGYTAVTAGAVTGTITNDDTDVSVAVAPASVTEDGAGNLVYTFTRTGVTATALTVNFTVGGGATFGTDYAQSGAATFTTTTGTVTFAAGATTAQVTLDPTVDIEVEGSETATITLAAGTGYTVAVPSAATGSIDNDDTSVSVSVAPASVTEDGAGNLVYTFIRNGIFGTTVTANFTLSGTAGLTGDYSVTGADSFNTGNGAGTIVFAPGETTKIVTVDPSVDVTIEADETVVATVTAGTGYNPLGTPATGTITNDDAEVTLAVSPASVTEDGAGTMLYTFTRTGFLTNALTVNFSVAGLAAFGTDYTQSGAASFTTTTGTVTFAAGSSTAVVTVDPTVDATGEGDENVALTITTGAGYGIGTPSAANGTILDDDTTVSVAVAPALVGEGSGTGLVYTFTRNGDIGTAILVNFSVGGTAIFTTDYTAAGATSFGAGSGTISIPVGATTAQVTLTAVNDALVEGDETSILTVTSGSGYGISGGPATGTIDDNDTATITYAAPASTVGEGTATDTLGFVLTIVANGTGTPTLARDVTFNVTTAGGGTATGGGTDYTLPATATFTAGALSGATTTAALGITNDNAVEGTETANLGLAIGLDNTGGQVTIGGAATHTTTITDNDTATIGYSTGTSSTGEGGSAEFGLVLTIIGDGTGPLTLDRNVTFNMTTTAGGTATGGGVDYTLPSTFTFNAGSVNGQSLSGILGTVNDALVEGTETANLGLALGADGTGGQVTISGVTGSHVTTITDNDTATIGFVAPTSSVGEAAGPDLVGVVLTINANGTGTPALARDVTFNVTTTGGSATGGGTDYTLPSTFTFPSGTLNGATQNASIAITNDTLVEGSETADLGLAIGTDSTGGQIAIAAGPAAAHVTTITDNDVDLSITKTDGVTSAVPGTSVTYTITVANAGLTSVVGANVLDTFAGILSNVTWSGTGLGGGTGTANGSGNINDLVNLPAGGSFTYTVTGTIASSATGTLVNTATVSAPAGFTDQNTGNNSATDTDTLTPQGDLAITKTDGVVSVIPGATTTYTITVSNAGPSDVVGANVADTFPAIFSNITFTAAGAGGATGFTANGAGNLNDTVNIPAGGSITYTVTGTVLSSATGTLSNTATVGVGGGFVDLNAGNNSATDTDTLTPQANLSVTKTDSPDPVIAGTNITYTIVLSNTGLSDATTVSLADTLPAGITFVSLSTVPGFNNTTPAVGENGLITISAASFAAGGTAAFTLVGQVASTVASGTVLSNTVTASTLTFDTDAGNNSSTATTTVATQADLAITKIDSVDPAIIGSTLTYTITLANNGASDAQTVEITDAIPAGMTFVSANLPAGWSATTPAVGSNGTVTFTKSSFAAGGFETFTIQVAPTGAIGGTTITNTASVTSTTTDPNAGNNSDSETTFIAGTDLTLTKSNGIETGGTITPGQTVTYTLTYTNNGFVDATGVLITETLPAGTNFVAAENPLWTDAGGGFYTFSLATLAVGASGTVNFVVHANSVAAAGVETVVNTATITDNGASGPDINAADNSASDTDSLTAAPDLQVTIVDDPATALRGRGVLYTITYANVGNQDSVNGTITQTLPANTTFNSGTSTPGWIQTSPTTFEFDIASLPAGASPSSVNFGVTVNSVLPGGYNALVTTSTIDDGGTNGVDPTPANNTDSETTPIYQGIYVVSPGIALPGRAAPPAIRVFDIATGTEFGINAYESTYRNSIRVATGDINGDGYDDIITSTITGNGRVRVFDGLTGERLTGAFSEIAAFTERGARGAYVASGDVTGDGRDDIIVGSGYAAGGTAKVRVFDGVTGASVITNTPFGTRFHGGVRVATGDVNGDGVAEIISSQGFGGNDIVISELNSGEGSVTNNVLRTIEIGGSRYRGGTFVASAEDLNGDGNADLIVGRDRGATIVELFNGATGGTLGSFTPFAPNYKLGARVAAADVNLDGIADIIVGSGGRNGSLVKIFDGVTKTEITGRSFAAFPAFPTGAIFVAGTSPVPTTGPILPPQQPA